MEPHSTGLLGGDCGEARGSGRHQQKKEMQWKMAHLVAVGGFSSFYVVNIIGAF